MSETEFKYRDNVAGILRNARGQILVCERVGLRESWQFPQGGIDPGETAEAALIRELREEISVLPADFSVLERRGPYRYLYGNGRVKKGCHGKEQHYFLCTFRGRDSSIRVDTEEPEFQAFRWIDPPEFDLTWLPAVKRPVYRAVFADFFGLEI